MSRCPPLIISKKPVITRDSREWVTWLRIIKNFFGRVAPVGEQCSGNQYVLAGDFFALDFKQIPGDNRPFLQVDVFGTGILGLVDSGSSHTIISYKIFQTLNASLEDKSPPVSIRTANGSTSKIEGVSTLPIHFFGRVRLLSVFVLRELSVDLILGMDFLASFGISTNFENFSFTVPRTECFAVEAVDLSPEDSSRLEILKNSYFEKSVPLGRTHLIKHHIDTGDASPIKQRYYPVSKPIHDFINEEVDRMLELDVIRPSKSPWSSPLSRF